MTNGGLIVDRVSVHFGGLKAVDEVSLSVAPGTVVGLIGPNGSGKSTFLNLVSRIYQPIQGEIRFDGRDILPLRPYETTLCGIARTFQNVRLFRSLTVLENLLVGCVGRTRAGFMASALALKSVTREEHAAMQRVLAIAAELGLTSHLRSLGSDLSYGNQKLVELGRALAAEPKLVLLDEPVAGMNAGEKENFIDLLGRLRRTHGLSILLVEHDMGVVMGLCEVVYVLDFGRLISQGTPKQVQEDPGVLEAYLGVEPDADLN